MLDQIKYTEIYNSILQVAKGLSPQPRTKEELKSRVISSFRYRAANNRSRRYGSRRFHSEKSPVSELISGRTTAEYLKINSTKGIILDKIISRVADELEINNKPSSVEMEKSLVNMQEIVKKMDSIAQQGSDLGKDIAKIPTFIETGKWE